MEEFLNSINQDIKDIFEHNIETTKAYVVPTRNDPTLTFPIGADKKGKLIETCVLMIDIRNSTKISRNLRNDKIRLGKIYSAFIFAMATIADEYGYVRNIVGDRIMVVFEPGNCFVQAVNCAALMNTVARRILKNHVAIDDFKIGIGIEYGEMLVLKTGIRKKHEEQSEYKNLVWVGDAANTASKLCDFSTKDYSSPIFNVTYENIKGEKVLKEFKPFKPSLLNIGLNPLLSHPEPEYEYKFSTEICTTNLNYQEFAKSIVVGANGWEYEGKKVTNFSLEKRIGTTASILMSGKVFKEFKNAEPKSIHLSRITPFDYPDKPFTGSGVYGGHLILPEISKIKI